ncbi:MAG TPA: hypothetical protein VIK75_00785 [Calditerricola sp.]
MREVVYWFVCDGCGRVVESTMVLEDAEDVVMGDVEPELPPGWKEIYADDEDRVYTCCSWECVEALANRSGGILPAVNE